MKYCTKCGAELLNDAVQCPQCGTPFSNGITKEQVSIPFGVCALLFVSKVAGILLLVRTLNK